MNYFVPSSLPRVCGNISGSFSPDLQMFLQVKLVSDFLMK